MSDRSSVWLRGALAAVAALGLVYAAGVVAGPVPYPPDAGGQIFIRAVPGAVATRLIEVLGPWAVRLLRLGGTGVALGLGILGASIVHRGATPQDKARRSLAAGGIMGGTSLLLALVAPVGLSVFAVPVYAVAALVYGRIAGGVRLGAALEPQLRSGEAPLDALRRSRRRFITRAVAGVGGALIGGAAVLRATGGRGPAPEIAPADLPFRPPGEDPKFPRIDGLVSEITPNDDFYNVDINLIKPAIDAFTWRLKLHGLVEKPYSLTYESLQSDFEVVELAHTLTCISNEVGGDLISTAVWRGVRLRDVLHRGVLTSGVVDVVFRAAEGYSDSIPLGKALEATTLVVFGMNGTALPRKHGFPARIIVPGIYGMKNVKWLTEIETVDHDYQGYWMVRGWSDEAVIKTSSRIDTPRDGEKVPLASMIAGVAWAGDRRVLEVQVSDDGGRTWRDAMLKRPLSSLTWRLWAAELQGRGRREVLVRAIDGEGSVQASLGTRPHPAGAGGLHAITLETE